MPTSASANAGSPSPGVRLIRSQLVSRGVVNPDGGARIIRVIGGRDSGDAPSGVRALRSQLRSRGTRAGIRIIGRSEGSVPRAGIRVIGGQDR
jgi:hypothetical protein